MPDSRRRTCKVCRRRVADCGDISWRGKCRECGPQMMLDAIDELHEHRGPTFHYWRLRIAASVGAGLPEPPTAKDW